MLRLQTNPSHLPPNNLSTQGQFLQFHCTNNPDYPFSAATPSALALISDQDIPPAEFDRPTVYQYSEGSSPSDSLPSSPLYEESPAPSSLRAKKPVTRLRSGNRVPRPRNAFMIFRSEFWADSKISKTVERDHRHISRIIGHCWNQLPEDEKDVWRHKAEEEKIEHAKRYPGYRFSPNTRTKQVVRRNVKRNGEDELLRCKQVAELILAGKAGEELDVAVKTIDTSLGREKSPPTSSTKVLGKLTSDMKVSPAFRSPLLPPADAESTEPQYSCHTTSSSDGLFDYQTTHPATHQESWTLQYSTSQQESPYATQYIPTHQQSNNWVLPQVYDGVSYATSTEAYQGTRAVSANFQQTFPRSSAFPIEFVNPFDYPLRNLSAVTHGNITLPQGPTPLDPLHWELSRHGVN